MTGNFLEIMPSLLFVHLNCAQQQLYVQNLDIQRWVILLLHPKQAEYSPAASS